MQEKSQVAHESGLPPHIQLLDVATRYYHSQCLFVVAKLGVADELAAGALGVEELAKRVGAHSQYLHRVLRALASIGIFAEDSDRRFGLTALADTLRKDHPQSVRDYVIMLCDDSNWDAWGALLHGVQSGERPFDRVFGNPYFEYLAAHPEKEQMFAASMSSVSLPQSAAIADAYPFGDVNLVVDVGGGNGHLLSTLLHKYPKLKGIVFDLPGVVEGARTNGFLTAADLGCRARAEGGNMFESVPSGADAYVIKTVIHDWDDEMARRILINCRSAMAPNGRVILAEGVVKAGNTLDFMKFLDLAMFASSGGRERTEDEYRDLLADAGLRLTRVIPTASVVSLLEAVRA